MIDLLGRYDQFGIDPAKSSNNVPDSEQRQRQYSPAPIAISNNLYQVHFASSCAKCSQLCKRDSNIRKLKSSVTPTMPITITPTNTRSNCINRRAYPIKYPTPSLEASSSTNTSAS